jgi:hypothetical protein
VLVTVYGSGEITVAPGTNLAGWGNRADCEAALVDETDYGYTAGWEIRTGDGRTKLVYEQSTMRSVVQCFPVHAANAPANR